MRSATIETSTLHLTGDWSETTDLDIYASLSVEKVVFNNQSISVERSCYGSLIGKISNPAHTISSIKAQLPPLSNWTVSEGLPERNASYDDSKWTGKSECIGLSLSS